MEFAEKLITLRKGRELTQEQLAEELNVSRQSISKWESGQVMQDVWSKLEPNVSRDRRRHISSGQTNLEEIYLPGWCMDPDIPCLSVWRPA